MIVGKIYFLLVRIKIRHMELAIIKREIAGTGKLNHDYTKEAFYSGAWRPIVLTEVRERSYSNVTS